MNWAATILVLITAFLAVFWESSFGASRAWLGAQIDLLPALIIYCGLRVGLAAVVLLAILGGLWFDSLSANPLGVSTAPLFLVGLVAYLQRDLVLRERALAQAVLGLVASVLVPLGSLVLLLSIGRTPLLGWGSLWQLTAMGLAGALAAPALFLMLDWLRRLLSPEPVHQTSFRQDREIRRGKS